MKDTKPRIKVKATVITTTFELTAAKYIFRFFTPTHDGTLFIKIVTTKPEFQTRQCSVSVYFRNIFFYHTNKSQKSRSSLVKSRSLIYSYRILFCTVSECEVKNFEWIFEISSSIETRVCYMWSLLIFMSIELSTSSKIWTVRSVL